MLIGIEASRANRLQKTGVEWYAYHVIQEMKKLPDAALHSWFLYSNDPLSMGLEKGPNNWREVRLRWPPKYLWTQARLSWEMSRRKPDVLFVPAHVLPRSIPHRTVVTIHDIGFHRFPELYKPIQRAYHEVTTRDIVKRASRILTVSAFSKREIVDAYHADPEKIVVTPLGIDQETYRTALPAIQQETLSRFMLAAPFVMFIGRLEKKKNVAMLIEAFTRYKQARGVGDPLSLVLVGQPGVGYEEIGRAIAASPARSDIKIVGYVTEQEKVALLSAAAALIHPALYEGFGLTPLEAMACGCPVLCSRVASLPEVVGDANALWFDPHDADALARQLAQLTDDPSLASSLRERGAAWCQRYRWETTASATLQALTRW